MVTVDNRKQIVDRLSEACHAALTEATNVCVAAGHREVVIEHFLISLCEQHGNDFRWIFRNLDLDIDIFIEKLKKSFSRFRSSNGEMPILSPLLFEMLESAWMITSLELNEQRIRSGAILLAIIRDSGRFCRYEYVDMLDRAPHDKVLKDFAALTSGSIEQVHKPKGGKTGAARAPLASESALEKYAENFTQQARDGRIDPVFRRDDEIRQIIDILARRRKNNPICVGEAGVGKTAVVEGLAYKIVHNDVPESLQGAEVYGLDMGALEAGASVKGEFEKRLKAVLDEVKNADRQTILFIDEAHTLIGAGGNAGGSDAANLLKPALARGEIKTIAATTWSEYKKYFEKDPALTRRFQLVKLDEPSVEDACVIIRGLVPAYEKAHEGVYISDAGVEAAARLSSRYITGRQLPDKAIDILDTACARVRAALTGVPLVIEKLVQESASLEREKEKLERDIDAGHDDKSIHERIVLINEKLAHNANEKERLLSAHNEQKQLVVELKELRNKNQGENKSPEMRARIISARQKFDEARKDETLISLEVGPEEIASVISDWTGIPVSNMAEDEIETLLHLKEKIGEVIKGQDHALQVIQERLQSSRLDLHKSGRPLGVFLLVGSTGTGKTETAIEVAKKLFGSEQFMTTVNMTEFQEKHTVSRLIGSPPGYIGYGEGGKLTEAIRKKPYSVVLLDEIEKADPDVTNLFYQVFDKGVLTDGEGRDIDCKNVIFFMCSNLASDQIVDLVMQDKDITSEEILTKVKPILINHFKPALLARIDPIVYLPLSKEVMKEIILFKIDELRKLFLEKQGLIFTIEDKAVDYFEALCNDAAGGARLIDQLLQKRIVPQISQTILESRLIEKTLTEVHVAVDNGGEFTFIFKYMEPASMEAAE
ncbi:type VI secretion system ATPase TssH [Bartonella sp. LJL80]